jgi:hypothetical protein
MKKKRDKEIKYVRFGKLKYGDKFITRAHLLDRCSTSAPILIKIYPIKSAANHPMLGYPTGETITAVVLSTGELGWMDGREEVIKLF